MKIWMLLTCYWTSNKYCEQVKRLLVGGSANAGFVACKDKGSCGQQSRNKIAFTATNRYSLIFNKTMYIIVHEELALRKVYRIQSPL